MKYNLFGVVTYCLGLQGVKGEGRGAWYGKKQKCDVTT